MGQEAEKMRTGGRRKVKSLHLKERRLDFPFMCRTNMINMDVLIERSLFKQYSVFKPFFRTETPLRNKNQALEKLRSVRLWEITQHCD